MISEINPEHIKLLENCFKKWKRFYHEEILHEMWCRYVEYENYYENYYSREAERCAPSRREKDLTAAGEEGSDDIEVGTELLGRWCGDGEFYDCVVEEVTETGYVVLFTEYGNREELTIDDLRWYDDIEVGAELLGRWYGDGEFYDCVVEKVTETGYVVLFTEYGNREELTIDDLRWYDDDEERWWGAGIIGKKIR